MSTLTEQDLLLSGYTADQIQEIEEGLQKNLDISFYANPVYLSIQMHQIRLGLEEGLPVEYYAKPYYDWFQMEEIRKGLRDGINVSVYARPAIPYDKMRQIRKGLCAGMDLSPYSRLEVGILRELRKSLSAGITLIPYIKTGYDREQLEAIRHALQKHIDIDPYLDIHCRGASIREIRLGLEHGLDVGIYAKPVYSWRKMREIRLGLEHRLDVTPYTNPLYSYWQMHEIRLGLEEDLNVDSYKSLMYTAKEMKHRRLMQVEHIKEWLSNDSWNTEALPSFCISVSPDEMEAYLEITEEHANITADAVLQALHDLGICHGIDHTVIDCLTRAPAAGQQFRIAAGTRPKAGCDGWYEYFFRTQLNRAPAELPDGSVDFQNVEWFETVEKGQTIAIYHPAEAGIAGCTVTGKTFPARHGVEQHILTGTGFQLLSDKRTYVAATTGRICLNHDKLTISSLLVLEAVNTATGNVNFDGSIYITGKVGAGASIHATGDIIINGYVESACIQCDGNILFRQGVNAAGGGQITAAGNIVGKFFETAKLHAGGDIRIMYGLNCTLYAGGKINALGSKGSIAGGTAYAEKGFEIHNAGNHAGLPTYLNMGLNSSLESKLSQFEREITEASKQLNILTSIHNSYQKKYTPKIRNTMDVFLKLEDAIYTKQLQIKQLEHRKCVLEERISKANRAKVIVDNTVFDNVIITMNNQTWRSSNMKHVVIKKVSSILTAVKI